MIYLNIKFGIFYSNDETLLYFQFQKDLSKLIILKQSGEVLFLQFEFLLNAKKLVFIRCQMLFYPCQ